MSLELVLLVPVLVLLTLFVLWAGRGGRAGLTADLAAEEAATAAALCCEEEDAGGPAREALVEDMLAARPGLQFLCVGGLRPEAPPDSGTGPAEFVSEDWLEFDPDSGARAGGVGVLGVRFSCETDGAVAPLRGLFPTVTFHGQASEVVVRRPLAPDIGFESTVFRATEAAGALEFRVTAGTPAPIDITVNYTVTAVTAAEGDDYEPPSGSVTIPAGGHSAEITVTLVDDMLYEGTETLELTLESLTDSENNPVSTTVADLDSARLTATGEILDDDHEPYLFVSGVHIPCEVTEGGALRFDVRLRNQSNTEHAPSASTVEVDFAAVITGTGDGHAAEDDDYMALSQRVTFAPTVTTPVRVAVQTLDDTDGEPGETFKVTLTNPSGARLGSTAEVTCTILDDEARVSVADASALESDGTLTFEVYVDRSPTADVVLEYRLQDANLAPVQRRATRGTTPCSDGDDYLGLARPPGTLIIPGGHNHRESVDLPVTVCDDLLVEPDEMFWLAVSVQSGEGVMEPDGGATGTITDDTPAITVSSEPVTEGEQVEFKVNLTLGGSPAELAAEVEVDYAVTEASPVSAEVDVDYEASTGTALTGTLTFGPGTAAEQTLPVQSLADYVPDEGDETFVLELSDGDAADGFALAAVEAVGTIINVDPPELTVDNPGSDPADPVLEGDTMTFTVTLRRGRAGETVTVNYAVESRSARAGRDFTAVAPGTLTLDADNPTATVDVATLTDKIAENNETLHLVLSGQSPSHVALAKAVGVGTITNVNPAVVRPNDPRADEGDPLGFVISLVDDVGQPATIHRNVTVEYYTADRTATAGADYTAVASRLAPGSVTFTPGGATTHSVPVSTRRDLLDEDDETMALILSVDPDNDTAVLGDAEGTGTITDAPPPRIRIYDPAAAVVEGAVATFAVRLIDENGLNTTTSETVTVQYATGDVTARAATDYVPVSGTLTFVPGGSVQAINVQTLTDDLWEPEEIFRVDLSGPVNAILDDATGIGRIKASCVDIDDADSTPPTITMRDERGSEASLRPVGWLTLSRPLCDPFSFTMRLVEGTTGNPAAAADIAVPSPFGTAFGGRAHAAGVSEMDVFAEDHPSLSGFLSVRNDSLDEPDEYFYLEANWSASMPAHYQGRPWARATVTIVDDDPEPSLRIADASATAGESLTFDVTLDAASGRTVEVDYRTVDGTATSPDDYTGVTAWTTLVFTPGETSKSITVPTAVNSLGETDETFRVELADPVNAGIDDSVAVGTILAGPAPTLAIADASGDEGSTLRFVVTLSRAAATEVTVDYATVEVAGSAEEGVDYTAASGTLTFAAGDTEGFIDVTANADTVDEADEIFLVELSNPTTGVSLADASAVGTINGNVDCVDRRNTSTEPMPTPSVSGTSAREDAGQIAVTYTVTKPLCQSHGLELQVGTGTATPGVDFTQPQDVILPALESSVDFHVPLIDDELVEDDEHFNVRIRPRGAPSMRNLAELAPDLTIIDDDKATLQLPAAGATSISEGGYLSFVVGLDKPSYEAVTFQYTTADGSAPAATADDDYAARSGTATIAAGRLSTTVAVRTIEDALFENDENVELRITNPVGAQPDPNGTAAIGRIIDDDSPPAVSVSDPVADEGAALSFDVTLDAVAGRAAALTYSTADGTATAGDDYTATSGTLTFAAGETSKTVSVPTLADDDVEESELLFLDLASTVLRFDDNRGAGTIRDATPRRLSISDAVVTEGGTLHFAVRFDGPTSSRDITVRYKTTAGTATAGDDYSDTAETAPRLLRILAGSTSATAEVVTVQDSLDEDTERLTVTLSAPSGAVLADSTAAGLILDDDPEPSLTVDDVEATENDDGTPVNFTLRLSEASGRAVSVAYSTADGTATAGDDYTAATGVRATIAEGQQSVLAPIGLVNDEVAEDVERFRLELSAPVNARLADSVGVATVLDDDSPPQILIENPAAVYEADGATVSFPVRLSRADTDNAVTVAYATADGTATAGNDYTAATGTLTIAAGETTGTVTVDLVNDDDAERTETFRLRLTNPSSNAVLGRDPTVATATVLDDDGLPMLSVSDTSATEGGTASFTVSLSRPSPRAVTVAHATAVDPLAAPESAAARGQDFAAVSGTLTVAARSTTATVAVALPDDTLDENTETFWLRLADPVGATLADSVGVGAIVDNDPLPQLTIGDAGATEGDTIGFAVQLNAASGRTVTVPWTTAATTTADSATAGEDFTAASGTLTYTSGTTAAHIDVATIQDEVSEADETFQVRLGAPTHATVDDGVAVGAINDDDGQPRLSIAGTEVTEDDSPATFAVTLSRTSSRTVTVDYTTAEDTATNPEDYGPPTGEATGTLTIGAGLDTGEISVFIADDNQAEEAETFNISLSNAQNAVIAKGAGAAVGTILDDDIARISIADVSAREDDGTITFPVTLNRAATKQVTVRYTTFDATATQPDDYIAASGTLTIGAGATTAAVTVTLTDDVFTENDESFVVRLSAPVGAEIADAEAVGVILDHDPLAELTIEGPDTGLESGTVEVAENDGSVELSVVLSRPLKRDLTVRYQAGQGPPIPSHCPKVIKPNIGTLVLPAGATARPLVVPLVDNDVRCADENYQVAQSVHLEPPSGVITGVSHVQFDIWDDEWGAFVFGGVDHWGVLEGSGSAEFYVELSYELEEDVEIGYYFRDPYFFNHRPFSVAATAGSDYTSDYTSDENLGTVTIPAGQKRATLEVALVDDSVAEPPEGLAMLRRTTTNASLGHPRWTENWIIDDDTPPELRVTVKSAAEGDAAALFEVSMSRPSGTDVTVRYATADGTVRPIATAPADYATASGTLTIGAGTTQALVSVTVVDDAVVDPGETFTLSLSQATGASIAVGTATATIADNEGLPTIDVHDASAIEGAYRMPFRLTLSEASQTEVTVRYAIAFDPSLGDRAASEHDVYYLDGPPYIATISPGDTSGTVNLQPAYEDLIPERDERFLLVLHSPVNAGIGDGRAWGTIVDDDLPIVSIANVSVSESATHVELTLALHAAGLDPASLRYATLSRPSAGEAAARPGEDYTHTTGTLNIPAGTRQANIRVPLIGDLNDEYDETFLVELSGPTGVEIDKATAVVTLRDDDDGWVIGDRGVNEGAGSMVFTVTRDHTSASAVTVNYTVTGASAVGGSSCTSGVDYITPAGSVTLQPTATTGTITVTICDDTDTEGSETLVVELTGVPGRKLTATGTITDND